MLKVQHVSLQCHSCPRQEQQVNRLHLLRFAGRGPVLEAANLEMQRITQLYLRKSLMLSALSLPWGSSTLKASEEPNLLASAALPAYTLLFTRSNTVYARAWVDEEEVIGRLYRIWTWGINHIVSTNNQRCLRTHNLDAYIRYWRYEEARQISNRSGQAAPMCGGFAASRGDSSAQPIASPGSSSQLR